MIHNVKENKCVNLTEIEKDVDNCGWIYFVKQNFVNQAVST